MKNYVPTLAKAILLLSCSFAAATPVNPPLTRSAPTKTPHAAVSAHPPIQAVKSADSSAAKSTPIAAATSVSEGQTGYVHYFLITHPNGDLEYQVGIELEDQRIAWSFPDAGVIVSEFVKSGTINNNGKTFKIEHLHGIRPFANSADMRALQIALPQRVAQWVDAETPYCLLRQPGEAFCLSCGDFVVRVIYPSPHPLIPALPRDFVRMTGSAYTTDDLLLYFVGLHGLPDKRAMLAKMATLDMPTVMRDDIIAMINAMESLPSTATVEVKSAPTPDTRNKTAATPPVVKPGATGRIATRRIQGKKI